MRRFLLLLFFFVISYSLHAQYPKIIDMQGMTNDAGNTWLVYKTNKIFEQTNFEKFRSDVHYFNPVTLQDSSVFVSFIADFGEMGSYGKYAGAFDYWDNDPFRYIRLALDHSFDDWLFVEPYYSEQTYAFPGSPGNNQGITISESNPKNVYLHYLNGTEVSSDSGRSWSVFSNNLSVFEVNPFLDSILYAYNDQSQLFYSSNSGKNFSTSNSSMIWNNAKFIFDKDSMHIYAAVDNRNENRIFISNDQGRTWQFFTGFSDENSERTGHIVLGKSKGDFYYAVGQNLYFSQNYGATFNSILNTGSQITGIYKSQNYDTIYISNPYKIYSFISNSLNPILENDLSPLLDYYPLKTGNSWFYFTESPHPFTPVTDSTFSKMEVIGDTVINNKSYKYIRYTFWGDNPFYDHDFIRIDSLNAKLYWYNSEISDEQLLLNLAAVASDTMPGRELPFPGLREGTTTCLGEESGTFLNQTGIIKNYSHVETFLYNDFSLMENIGLIEAHFSIEFGYSYTKLQGAVINGTIYGDTMLTALEPVINKPSDFALYQNYPNPFNAQTKITYHLQTSGLVQLDIFDLRGRLIQNIVNEQQKPGDHSITFDGNNLASGIYYYRIKSGNFIKTKKMILIK